MSKEPAPHTELLACLDEFKEASDTYFKKFNEFYPLFKKGVEGIFGPSELYELALKAQCLVGMLGPTATRRLKYVGFGMLFPFDNPVDWYEWKEAIVRRSIPQSIYFSIAIRLDSEIARIRFFLDRGKWDDYQLLSDSEYLVSKERYAGYWKELEETGSPSKSGPVDAQLVPSSTFSINELNINLKSESEAVNNLDKWQKRSEIWANIIDVVTKSLGVKI